MRIMSGHGTWIEIRNLITGERLVNIERMWDDHDEYLHIIVAVWGDRQGVTDFINQAIIHKQALLIEAKDAVVLYSQGGVIKQLDYPSHEEWELYIQIAEVI